MTDRQLWQIGNGRAGSDHQPHRQVPARDADVLGFPVR